jgi:hypothetical protein
MHNQNRLFLQMILIIAHLLLCCRLYCIYILVTGNEKNAFVSLQYVVACR